MDACVCVLWQELENRIVQALECPCVADLKAGPCGELFVTTFTCFQRSRAEPKGCDCLDVSLAFAVSSPEHRQQQLGLCWTAFMGS